MTILVVLAAAEPPYVIYGAVGGLIAIGLGFVLKGYRILRTELTTNTEHNKICWHLLGYERARTDHLAKKVRQAGLPISPIFWQDPGPPGTPIPNFDQEPGL